MVTINDKFSKKTKYDTDKETKYQSFVFLNEKFPDDNSTVLVGDSLIEQYSTDFFIDFSKKSDQLVYNRGIGGDTSDRMYERLIDNVMNLRPKNVVIEIGTNDFGLGAPVEFTFCNIEKSINLIKKTLPDTNIIVLSVFPVNKGFSLFSAVGKRENEVISDLNSRLMRLSQSHEFIFLDVTEKLSDKKEKLSWDFTFDGLHLNANGYDAINDSVIELLK